MIERAKELLNRMPEWGFIAVVMVVKLLQISVLYYIVLSHMCAINRKAE
jgi:hypothetical protein